MSATECYNHSILHAASMQSNLEGTREGERQKNRLLQSSDVTREEDSCVERNGASQGGGKYCSVQRSGMSFTRAKDCPLILGTRFGVRSEIRHSPVRMSARESSGGEPEADDEESLLSG